MSRQPSSAGALAGAAPLIATKLLPPRGRPELVARPRLLRALDEFGSAALTLVDAPVGFGKTVLAQTWGAQSNGAIAWVSIDAADDDPVRLWTYVSTAVDRIRPGLGRGALARLRVAGASPEAAVDELVNGITAYGQPLALVLDDLHTLQNNVCLRSFEHAVECLPSNARIVATTRSDPAIALGRLRARGDLGEIRAGQLAFTLEEARKLIVEHERIALTDADVEMLVERTEGWPAGLYLAALWLRTLDDPGAGVRDFHGDHRHVADYLTGEVLDTLRPETRDFLLRTSILGRFNGALCDAVLGRTGSARLITELARSNLFLVGLDPQGKWFRYHHLFRELLQLELGLVDPSAAQRLHLLASTWCREHGFVEEALEHAHAAGDETSVAEMLVERYRELTRTGRHATLLRWLAKLPPARILENPILAPAGALASGLMIGREAEERHRFIALATRAREERPAEWTPLHESVLGLARAASVNGDIGAALASARLTADIGRTVDEIAVATLASLGLLLFLSGRGAEARFEAQDAVSRPEALERPHGYVYALATLALVDAEMGASLDAESKARQALAFASAAGIAETASGGVARLSLAAALAASGRLADAEREAAHAERLRRQTEPDATHLYAVLVLADIRAKRGYLSRASADLRRATAELAGFRDPGVLAEVAARVERRIEDARLSGQLDEAPSAAELSVLRLLATDLSQREIGLKLFVSVNTVKTHTRALYRKLGATSREDAVKRAAALGLLAADDSPG